jgi:CHASE3 domain sensor protein
MNFLANFRIRDWLIAGFGLITLILMGTIAINLWQVRSSATLTEDMVAQRLPSTMTGNRLVANVQGSVTSLRDWMLTGNSDFKAAAVG